MIARRPLIFADGHVEWRQVETAARFVVARAEPIPHIGLRDPSPTIRNPAPEQHFISTWFRGESGITAQAFVERDTAPDVRDRAFVDLVVPILEIAPQRGGP